MKAVQVKVSDHYLLLVFSSTSSLPLSSLSYPLISYSYCPSPLLRTL